MQENARCCGALSCRLALRSDVNAALEYNNITGRRPSK